jgi:hypothetical protein
VGVGGKVKVSGKAQTEIYLVFGIMIMAELAVLNWLSSTKAAYQQQAK